MASKTLKIVHPKDLPCDCRPIPYCIEETLAEVTCEDIGRVFSIVNPPVGYEQYATFMCLGNGCFKALEQRTRLDASFGYTTGGDPNGTVTTPIVVDGETYEFQIPFNVVNFNLNSGFAINGNVIEILQDRDVYEIKAYANLGILDGDPANMPSDGYLGIKIYGTGLNSYNTNFARMQYTEAAEVVGLLASAGETQVKREITRKVADMGTGDFIGMIVDSTWNAAGEALFMRLEVSGYDLGNKVICP